MVATQGEYREAALPPFHSTTFPLYLFFLLLSAPLPSWLRRHFDSWRRTHHGDEIVLLLQVVLMKSSVDSCCIY